MVSVEVALNVINAAGFVAFVSLLGLAVVRMLLRIRLYIRTGKSASIVLRRDLGLMGSFLLVFGSIAFIRFFGWNSFIEQGWPRLIYITLSYVVVITGLGYWVWAEYFVIGHPDKEDE